MVPLHKNTTAKISKIQIAQDYIITIKFLKKSLKKMLKKLLKNKIMIVFQYQLVLKMGKWGKAKERWSNEFYPNYTVGGSSRFT